MYTVLVSYSYLYILFSNSDIRFTEITNCLWMLQLQLLLKVLCQGIGTQVYSLQVCSSTIVYIVLDTAEIVSVI